MQLWIRAAIKNGGDASLGNKLRADGHFSIEGRNYATGGAREGRCREKESLGAECCGTAEMRVSGASAIVKAMRAEASAGICSA